MNATLDDRYIVFVREEAEPDADSVPFERELVTCSTYEEAQWMRRQLSTPTRKCIIRFVGPVGGGD
jgi:hypothetical protein